MHNKKIQKILTYAAWKMFGTLVVVLTAGGALWALAAFTEPTVGPAASVQDFAKNILGANNADNGFDSSAVTANADGSIVERMEGLQSEIDNLKKRASGPTALSAESAATTNSYAVAATYCRNLSAAAQYAIDGSDTSTVYTDWRLPKVEELFVFKGVTTSGNNLWTASPYINNGQTNYIAVVPLNETGSSSGITSTVYYINNNTRCVR